VLFVHQYGKKKGGIGNIRLSKVQNCGKKPQIKRGKKEKIFGGGFKGEKRTFQENLIRSREGRN